MNCRSDLSISYITAGEAGAAQFGSETTEPTLHFIIYSLWSF